MLNPAASVPSPSAQRTFLAPPEPPPLARMPRSFGAAGPSAGPRSCTLRRLTARLLTSAASSASSSNAAHLESASLTSAIHHQARHVFARGPRPDCHLLHARVVAHGRHRGPCSSNSTHQGQRGKKMEQSTTTNRRRQNHHERNEDTNGLDLSNILEEQDRSHGWVK